MTKFNEEITKQIIENHASGLTIKDCAAIAGIHRTLLHKWIKRGKEAKSGKYHDFYLAMKKARAEFIKVQLQRIAESKDWRASRYLLQTVDPENYVITEKQAVKAEVDESKGFENLINAFEESKKQWKEYKNEQNKQRGE